MDIQKQVIDKISFYILFMWTLLLIFLASFLVYSEYDYANHLALNEAQTSVKKDLAYRTWVSSHGGVYVPITEKTPPNLYLSHVKDRDVNTTSNQQLTLMNPAYTLSQMMARYAEFYGSKGHITSNNLLNPANAPDKWEEKALYEMEKLKKPISEIARIDGEKYMRYIAPLVTDASCLKCHELQGYKIGDVRGGVSVSISMKSYLEQAFSFSVTILFIALLLWFLGFMTILYVRKYAKKEIEKKIRNYEQNIFSMVKMIEKRDSYTAGHSQRVADYSVLIAREMGYSKKLEHELYTAAMLHDIGKISTPDSILLKPGKLSDLEFEIIKEHVVTSYDILKKIDIYHDIAEIVKYHHERYDGDGYPYGMKGDDTPISSQIMTIADAFDAMTTNRIYKARKNVNLALKELENLAGKQFHPEIVKHAVIALKDVKIDIKINQRPKTKIERERFAYFYNDSITELYNKKYLTYVLAYNDDQEYRMKFLYSISLHNFSAYNKKYGWIQGDAILKKVANVMISFDEESLVFRVFGDYFIVVSKKDIALQKHLQKLEDALAQTNISFSYKHYDLLDEKITDISDLQEML